MMRNGEHFLNGTIPAEIAENLNEFFPEFGDLNYEEVLQHQVLTTLGIFCLLSFLNRQRGTVLPFLFGNSFLSSQNEMCL